MLMSVYMFSLVFGGVLLLASVVLGGHDSDIDSDLDLDADVAAEADLSAGAEVDTHVGSAEAGAHAADVGDIGSAADFIFHSIRSLRFWTFFMAFFGLTGMLLDGFALSSSRVLTFVSAVVMGKVAGFGISAAVRALSNDRSSMVVEGNDYVGKTARVMVPVHGGGLGKVRVEIRGQHVDLLAKPVDEHDANPITAKDDILIVEMDGTTARVARVNDVTS